jgi:hypothetical protein
MATLFKIFVDPEEEKIRLVIADGERLINREIQTDTLPFLFAAIQRELTRMGKTLYE